VAASLCLSHSSLLIFHGVEAYDVSSRLLQASP
jgi:hypothetical protein